MKIAVLTSEYPPFNGGISTYARELVAAAVAAGHDVTLLAPDQLADQDALDATLPGRIVRYRSGPASGRGLWQRIVETRRLLSRERFDIVHAADWPFFIPLRLCRALQPSARMLLTIHGSETVSMQAPKRRMLLRAIRFWRGRWARWIANSDATRAMLLEGFPQVRPDEVRTVLLALPTGWSNGRVNRDVARARFDAGDDFILISLGRVVPRKGHADIADALARLPEVLARKVRWWIVGPLIDAEHEAFLRAKVQALPVRTEFLGNLPLAEVQGRLSASDTLCLPGYRDGEGRIEGFGLVFLEAGAYGVPSIATRSGGIGEVIDDGVGGLLVDERNVVALSAAIERVLENPALHAELARGAQRRAEATTWHDVMFRTYNP